VDPSDQVAQELWERWTTERRQLAAPTLLYYEVANSLYRYETLGLMSASSVQLALNATLALPINLQGEPDLHRRALELAKQFSLPAAYDAHYLALAEHLNGEFWTADGKLARSVQGSLTWVQLAPPK
jgi:predicted nucleic acid-binding protein